MSEGPKRRWFAYSLRTLFVAVAVLGCWLGYQLNWIHQRRALKAEGDQILEIVGNYVGTADEDIPPSGSSIAQRLLSVLGEPGVSELIVFFVVDDVDQGIETADFPKIRRARSLFPEAKIISVWIQRSYIQGPDAFLQNVSGLISE